MGHSQYTCASHPPQTIKTPSKVQYFVTQLLHNHLTQRTHAPLTDEGHELLGAENHCEERGGVHLGRALDGVLAASVVVRAQRLIGQDLRHIVMGYLGTA